MPAQGLYTSEDIRKTYEQTDDHVHTKTLITKYSTNPHDIRDIALQGLNLANMTRILELGCGYGSFTKNLGGMLDNRARITGIDMVAENGPPFLTTVDSIGYRGLFIHNSADIMDQMESNCFDMVIASYSLYFFPHLIGEISRVLHPEGVFITITHSRYSLQEVLRFLPQAITKLGLKPPEETSLARLFDIFSLENGESMLAPCFARIEKIIYQNTLTFRRENINDCIDYLEKKGTLLFKDIYEKYPSRREAIRTLFYEDLSLYTEERGRIDITKDDVIFHCFEPRNDGQQKGSS